MKIIRSPQFILFISGLFIFNSCGGMSSSYSPSTPKVETEKSHGMAKPAVKNAM